MKTLNETNMEMLKNAFDMKDFIQVLSKDKGKMALFIYAMNDYHKNRISKMVKRRAGLLSESYEKEEHEMARSANIMYLSFEEMNDEKSLMRYAVVENQKESKKEFARVFVEEWNREIIESNLPIEMIY